MLKKLITIACITSLFALLSACGQKGSLYLVHKQKPSPNKTTKVVAKS